MKPKQNLFDIVREINRKKINDMTEKIEKRINKELPEGLDIEFRREKKKTYCPICLGLNNDCLLCGGTGIIETMEDSENE